MVNKSLKIYMKIRTKFSTWKVDAVVCRLINCIYHIIFKCFEGETGVDLFGVDGQVKLFVRVAEHFAAEKIALGEHARQTCYVAVFAC